MNIGDFQVDLLVAKGLYFDGVAQSSTDFVAIERYGDFNWKYEGLEHNNVLYGMSILPSRKLKKQKKLGIC